VRCLVANWGDNVTWTRRGLRLIAENTRTIKPLRDDPEASRRYAKFVAIERIEVRLSIQHRTLMFAAALAMMLSAQARSEPQHAIAMHGEPALPAGFSHFAYVNPDAPKGGRMVQGVLGTFDSLNPFIVRGLPPQGLRAPLTSAGNIMTGTVVESLMVRGFDEPFTLYGLLARTVETDQKRSYVTFGINPAARFSDGKPVTAADVLFSWQLFRDKGRPNQRTYYKKVVKAEALDELTVRFDFGGSEDRELPLILGLMSILPRHAINPDTFEETSLKPLVGSGPYVVAAVDAGKSVTLRRSPGYWGRDLGVNRGFWNFDELRFEYYRDANSYHEAFKAGLFEVRPETDPGRWQTAYDFPALREGRVVKEMFRSGLPKPNFFFAFNTRRAIFSDIRVREALALLFDFEWINHNIFFDLYRRSGSYFEGSELSARGRAADERERALLAPFPDAVRADVLDGTWSPAVSDGSGRDRTLLRRALGLLTAAGYEQRGTALVNKQTGKPFAFEFLATSRDEERLALLYASSLKRAGIAMQVRLVDAVQYETRRIGYEFDMVQNRMDQSLSPGNEQAFYWSTAAAESEGTRNYMGIKSPAVDAMIAALLTAQTRPEVVSAVRALDRSLISGSYVVPLFYVPDQWIARWTTLAHPEKTSLHGMIPETWWRRTP
jgi:peptide/nickel transport system substrate-binding protein